MFESLGRQSEVCLSLRLSVAERRRALKDWHKGWLFRRNPKQITAYVQVLVELTFLRFHGPRKNNRRHSATLRIVPE